MGKAQIIQTVCGLCGCECGVLVTLEDGQAVKIQGDPDRAPTRGKLCVLGLASLEYIYHPDRLRHPLQRTGDRGEGKWRKISWDEAFGQAAESLNKVKRENGAKAVVMVHGSAKGLQDTLLVRLANAFGTPNVVSSDNVCSVPRMLGADLTFGFSPAGELAHPPACVVIWGRNPSQSWFSTNLAILKAVEKGTKLIVIDPLKIDLAEKAALYLRIRPGTDLALALGMVNVIINEGLYDNEFVDKWTVGFEELKAHVQDYSPPRVSQITWVPTGLIIQAARLYATSKPAHIHPGNALDHNVNSIQGNRATAILRALTGNIGVPGGEIEKSASGFRYHDPSHSSIGLLGRWSSQLELRDIIPRDERRSKVGADLNMLPDFRYATPYSVVRSILEGEPYRIKAAYIQASNPLSSWPNIRKVYQAVKKLDFLVVTDMFMTPTAALADVVFPVASYLEYDAVKTLTGEMAKVQRKVVQIEECLSDIEIVNNLAKKLGLGKYFWDSPDDFWDATVKPAGLTFEELKKKGTYSGNNDKSQKYKLYEKNGFNTPSGKVEFYSRQLEEWGFDPLPVYYEPPETPFSDPKMARKYPLLCTTRKLIGYHHSRGRQLASLRHINPDPVVFIHPETAGRLGIAEGDWVYIENSRGKIRQRAKVTVNVDPRVVVADHGWWYPEKGQVEFFGWADSNYNVLTSDKPPFNREIGSFNVRGLACKVYKEAR